jgi:hypothetical protein
VFVIYKCKRLHTFTDDQQLNKNAVFVKEIYELKNGRERGSDWTVLNANGMEEYGDFA